MGVFLPEPNKMASCTPHFWKRPFYLFKLLFPEYFWNIFFRTYFMNSEFIILKIKKNVSKKDISE